MRFGFSTEGVDMVVRIAPNWMWGAADEQRERPRTGQCRALSAENAPGWNLASGQVDRDLCKARPEVGPHLAPHFFFLSDSFDLSVTGSGLSFR